MTRLTKTAALALAHLIPLGIVAGMAAAQGAEIDPAVDVNRDGMYSFVELVNLYPEFEVDTFTLADINGDGLLDQPEVAAAFAAGMMPVPSN